MDDYPISLLRMGYTFRFCFILVSRLHLDESQHVCLHHMDCASQSESQYTIRCKFYLVVYLFTGVQLTSFCKKMDSGLGLLPISFDWTQINQAGKPLMTPFYATCNVFAVVVLFYFFLAPIFYYSNVWNSA